MDSRWSGAAGAPPPPPLPTDLHQPTLPPARGLPSVDPEPTRRAQLPRGPDRPRYDPRSDQQYDDDVRMAETVDAPRAWTENGANRDPGGDTRTGMAMATVLPDSALPDSGHGGSGIPMRSIRADYSAGWRDRHALGLVAPVGLPAARAASLGPRERGQLPPHERTARWSADTMHMEHEVGGQWPQSPTTPWHPPAQQATGADHPDPANPEHVPPRHDEHDGYYRQSAHVSNSLERTLALRSVAPRGGWPPRPDVFSTRHDPVPPHPPLRSPVAVPFAYYGRTDTGPSEYVTQPGAPPPHYPPPPPPADVPWWHGTRAGPTYGAPDPVRDRECLYGVPSSPWTVDPAYWSTSAAEHAHRDRPRFGAPPPPPPPPGPPRAYGPPAWYRAGGVPREMGHAGESSWADPPPPGYPVRRPLTRSAPASEWAWPVHDRVEQTTWPPMHAGDPTAGAVRDDLRRDVPPQGYSRDRAQETTDASRASAGVGAVDPVETRETAGPGRAGRGTPHETAGPGRAVPLETATMAAYEGPPRAVSRAIEAARVPAVPLAPMSSATPGHRPLPERITTATASTSTPGFRSPAPRAMTHVESTPASGGGVELLTAPAPATGVHAAADVAASRWDHGAAHIQAHVGSIRFGTSGTGHGRGRNGHPYPTRAEKDSLMATTGLTLAQLENFLVNYRRRTLKKDAARTTPSVTPRDDAAAEGPPPPPPPPPRTQ
ncbi:hypothetical protein GGF31_005184 [Allomyces arbusculus]|nr:hypothetical protein GGF31_005184 [Allomyces arbusculus]